MVAEKVSRNSPCPCGSGKKYKRCCELAAGEKKWKSQLPTWVVVIVLLAGALALILGLASDRPEQRRVWSPEHGHWHTVP